MSRRISLAMFVIAFGSLVATASRAATITVSSTASVTSIGMALSLADPGDTIVVKTGVYHESLSIPGNLDGLTIVGVGKAILDARTLSGLGLGGAIVIAADDVTISNLTIRNAAVALGDIGDGIRSTGAGTAVTKCRFVANENAGIALGGTGASVSNCTFTGNAFGIVLTSAIDTTISKSSFRRSHAECVSISGATNTTIDKCSFEGADAADAIDADEALVNTTLTVKSCKFRSIGGSGVAFEGSALTIDKCSFKDIAGDGIVANNAATIAITKCSGQDIAGAGVALSGGSNAVVTSCSFKRAGRQFQAGILADSVTTVTLTKVAVSDSGEGFAINGCSTVTLNACTAKDCDRDGFDVDSLTTDAALTSCKASGCVAEGLDNSSVATTATNCTFKGNRIDVANDGTLTVAGGSFTSGGIATLPSID